jgi:hypothetical protein
MPDENFEEGEGGESACFAHLICPECGIVLDGSEHARGCDWVDYESVLDPTDNFTLPPGD